MFRLTVIPLRPTAKALAATVLGSLALAPGASASSTQTTFFEAPRDLTAAGTSTEGRKAALDTIESLGATALRVNLRWYDVAPQPESTAKPAFDATDPAQYSWGAYGQVIDDAKARGWTILISPSSAVPKWATRAKADTVTRPSAPEFKLFTQAVAKRFAGTKVMWSIWNEPNLENFLRPQVVGGKFVAGDLYRELFIAGRSGIKSVDPKARVLFGETAPSGVQRKRQKPISFLRDALCVTSKYKADKKCGGKLSVDGFAHHPYRSIKGIPRSPDDVTYQVLSRYTRAIDKIAKARQIPARRALYLTEFGIQSLPDKLFGVSEQQQLEERARAERIAYANPRVRGFSQYLLTDDNPTVPGRLWSGFETGLRDHTGKDKPSFTGFRLTLDVLPGSKRASLWGLVRPAKGVTSVVLERKIGSRDWSTWKTIKTRSNGSFTTTDSKRKSVQYRYRWTSPTLGELTSPPVRPFKG
ncbi:MAG: cellulase family glycosylhydrolase [Solirubrobacteraceae bacterium]|nr:cellulase family glycosylhydrolase [Solirubrobacteraceae bacterium]